MKKKNGKYISKKGIPLDLQTYVARHSQEIAVGNANYNTRGDILGPGGKVVKKVEERAKEYYQDNPKAIKRVSIKPTTVAQVEKEIREIDQTSKNVKKSPAKEKKKKAPEEIIKFEGQKDDTKE